MAPNLKVRVFEKKVFVKKEKKIFLKRKKGV
jgi:hypothetical protein